jgi:endonuclease-8
VLFAARVPPFAAVAALDDQALRRIVDIAQRQLRLNAESHPLASSGRRTTGRLRPDERLFVYGRAGAPCFRCGAAILVAREGADARRTFYCPSCQAGSGSSG